MVGDREFELTDDFRRVGIFPKQFKKEKAGKVYRDKPITLNPSSSQAFKDYHLDAIYDADGSCDFLESRDIVKVEGQGLGSEEFIQITHKCHVRVKDYVGKSAESHKIMRDIEMQLGRSPEDGEEIYVYEFRRAYGRQFEHDDSHN
jgi:hypothetical protein